MLEHHNQYWVCATLAVLFLIFPAILHSTGPSNLGAIEGTVETLSEKPLIFASVVLVGTELGGMTDSEGKFRIMRIPSGTYELKVSYIAFESESQSIHVTHEETTVTQFILKNYETQQVNEVQSLMKADDCGAAIEAIIDLVVKEDHADPTAWQNWAICLNQKDDPQAAVAALMFAKSLTGSDVSVGPAVENAVKDTKEAVQELGNPDLIRTSQEASGGNQVESWIWIEKRTAMIFILGVKNGEVTW